MVKEHNPKKITLAIGDGANDIRMLKAAHIGVGIAKKYDQQISRQADYMIGEFKLLKPLMFVFGSECYRRNCQVILFILFKSLVISFPIFWMGFYNFFTPFQFYETFID